MGKGIDISKYKIENNIHYYLVSKYDPVCYIGIEPEKKLVWLYKDEDFSQLPLGVIDFNQEKPLKSIPGLHDNDVAIVAMQAGLAMHRNKFPDYIGFSS